MNRYSTYRQMQVCTRACICIYVHIYDMVDINNVLDMYSSLIRELYAGILECMYVRKGLDGCKACEAVYILSACQHL